MLLGVVWVGLRLLVWLGWLVEVVKEVAGLLLEDGSSGWLVLG